MVNWFNNLFAVRRERPKARSSRMARSAIRARFDSAQTTAENAEHWSQADNLSARAANSLAVRRTIRNRSRYECGSNSYAAGMLLTLANDLIGTGPRLQMLARHTRINNVVETDWKRWARETNLAQKLRTAVITKKRDGEVFLRFFTNPLHQSNVWLDVEVIEGDQVTTPTLVPNERQVDGITFDEFGNPQIYDILKQHPGDEYAADIWSPEKIPAKDVIHWFRCDRPGQRRGISEINPALPLFAQLRRYTLSVLTASETAADHAAVLQSGSSANADDADELTPFEEVNYARGMLTAVPFGWQLAQLRAEQPTTTYGMFKHEILNEIARCLNMPFNVAAGNSAGYNYSSGRLDHQIYFRSIWIEQSECESVILDRIFAEWFGEYRLQKLVADQTAASTLATTESIEFISELLKINVAERPYSWAWDPSEDLDPSKTATARWTSLESGLLSYQQAFAEMGLDWQTEQSRQAEALGITVDEYRALLRQKLFGTALASGAIPDPYDTASGKRSRTGKARRRRSLFGQFGLGGRT